jgi:hypothetical protein
MIGFLTVVMLPDYSLFDWHSQEPGTTVEFVSKHPLLHQPNAIVTSFYTQSISRVYVHTLTVVWHTLAHGTHQEFSQMSKTNSPTDARTARQNSAEGTSSRPGWARGVYSIEGKCVDASK